MTPATRPRVHVHALPSIYYDPDKPTAVSPHRVETTRWAARDLADPDYIYNTRLTRFDESNRTRTPRAPRGR